MKQALPRCNLPTSRSQKSHKVELVIPPPRLGKPCVYCGERSYYCTHKRKNDQYICENCYRKQTITYIGKKKQWLWDHKAGMGCVLCKESDPACLDYHHLHPKKKKFSIGSVASSIPDYAIKIEMKKCVVICANCHRQVEALHKE